MWKLKLWGYVQGASIPVAALHTTTLAQRGLGVSQWQTIDQNVPSWKYPNIFAFWAAVDRLGTASYVRDLTIEGCDGGSYGTFGPQDLSTDEICAFEAAVRASPYIEADRKDSLIQDATHGNEGDVFAILLPQLLNLERISLPAACWGGSQLGNSAENAISNIASDSVPRTLTRLTHITGNAFNGYYGIDLEGSAPFLALPSVLSLSLVACHEDQFEWPENLPKSSVRKIALLASSVSSEAAQGLARGIEGPCLIRQEWGPRRHDNLPEPNSDWSYLEVPFKGAKEEDWIMKIDNEEDVQLVYMTDSHRGWSEDMWPEYARGLVYARGLY